MQGVNPIRHPDATAPARATARVSVVRALLCIGLVCSGSITPVGARPEHGGGERVERDRFRDELRQQALEERIRRREAQYTSGGERRGYFVPPGMPAPLQPDPMRPQPAPVQPGNSYPGDPYQGQPYRGQQYPAQPYPGQPYPGQPYQGQPYPGQTLPGRAYPAYPQGQGSDRIDRGHRQRLSPEERELLREQLRERRRLLREGGER